MLVDIFCVRLGDADITLTTWASAAWPLIVVPAPVTEAVAAPISLRTVESSMFLLTIVFIVAIVLLVPEFTLENTTPAIWSADSLPEITPELVKVVWACCKLVTTVLVCDWALLV